MILFYQANTITWEQIWGLYKSTNGTHWTLVKEWSEFDYAYGSSVSMAVSNGNIYILFSDTDVYTTYHVVHSANSGATWGHTTLSNPDYNNNSGVAKIAAHDSTAIVYLTKIDTDLPIVMQSTNGGITWTETFRIDYSGYYPPAYPSYPTVRASGDLFLMMFCLAYSPMDGLSWTANGETYDMSGEGEGIDSYLVFWMSTDAGATWSMQTSPLIARSEDATQYWQQSMDAICLL
jgi:hypothetical protein